VTRFHLWCPDQDGTQHFDCVPEDGPDNVLPYWRQVPTWDQVLKREADADIPQYAETEFQRKWRNALGGDGFTPLPCHFDKVDPTNERPEWPEHYVPYSYTAQWQWARNISNLTGGWQTTELYPQIKRLYRCTVHGKKPDAVNVRPSWQREERWARLIRDVFEQKNERRTQEMIRRFYPDYVEGAYAIDYMLRNIHSFVSRRPPPRTTHDVW